MRYLLVAVVLLIGHDISASSFSTYFDESYERIVVPVGEDRQSGAFGTVWRLDGWVFNSSNQRVTLSLGAPICFVMCEGNRPSVGPGLFPLSFRSSAAGTPNGMFFYFPREHSEDLTFHVRLVLETPEGDQPSVEIPIIREQDFRTAPIVLIDVPNSRLRRVMIRVYEGTGELQTSARIRVFEFDGTEILAERVVSTSIGISVPSDFPPHSGFAQLPLSELLDLSTAPERLRIEVTGESPEELPIWAFATITENDTQHVTLVTPQ